MAKLSDAAAIGTILMIVATVTGCSALARYYWHAWEMTLAAARFSFIASIFLWSNIFGAPDGSRPKS